MRQKNTMAVLPIQLAVAAAAPGSWRDAIVVSSRDGILRLDPLDGEQGGDQLRLATDAAPEIGTPVAVHPVAELLAVGAARFNARPIS